MTQSNYAARLQASIKAEAERLAEAEGTTLNQFINCAVAEKIAALRTADLFRERARRANLPGALALLDRLGNEEPPPQAMNWNSASSLNSVRSQCLTRNWPHNVN